MTLTRRGRRLVTGLHTALALTVLLAVTALPTLERVL